MKIPNTPAGFEPATFRFVAQQNNHCATSNDDQYIFLLYLNQFSWQKTYFRQTFKTKSKFPLKFNNFSRISCRFCNNIKNIVELGRPQKTICGMSITYLKHKATNTLSVYVIFIEFHGKNVCMNVTQRHVIGKHNASLDYLYLNIQFAPQRTQCDSIRNTFVSLP